MLYRTTPHVCRRDVRRWRAFGRPELYQAFDSGACATWTSAGRQAAAFLARAAGSARRARRGAALSGGPFSGLRRAENEYIHICGESTCRCVRRSHQTTFRAPAGAARGRSCGACVRLSSGAQRHAAAQHRHARSGRERLLLRRRRSPRRNGDAAGSERARKTAPDMAVLNVDARAPCAHVVAACDGVQERRCGAQAGCAQGRQRRPAGGGSCAREASRRAVASAAGVLHAASFLRVCRARSRAQPSFRARCGADTHPSVACCKRTGAEGAAERRVVSVAGAAALSGAFRRRACAARSAARGWWRRGDEA